jgi:arabinan endo-1,5-alpha-L-arabinosidase
MIRKGCVKGGRPPSCSPALLRLGRGTEHRWGNPRPILRTRVGVPQRIAFGWWFVALITLGIAASAGAGSAPVPLPRGSTRIHDPSTLVREGDRWWVFGTGRGIVSLWSTNRVDWEQGPPVLREPPSWAAEWVPNHQFRYWAPDIIRIGDRYLLYYSVSTWGSRQSGIGLLVGRALDPASPLHGWEDRGPVVRTTEQDNHNAIDPALFHDRDGRLWMVYGSYWSGIQLVELDPTTGLRRQPQQPLIHLAWKEAIEAAALFRRGDDYFLFVNWGQCCRGTNSTYEIRVGRSKQVTGPYVDREGRDLRHGGGSLLLGTSGRFIGPGHAAFFEADGQWWMSYHFYDGAQGGRSVLDILPLQWDEDGWPVVEPRRGE